MLYVALSWPHSDLCGWQILNYFLVQGKLVVTFAWQVDPFCSVSAAHDIGENVRHQIHKTHPVVSEAFIHIGKQHSFTWLLLKIGPRKLRYFWSSLSFKHFAFSSHVSIYLWWIKMMILLQLFALISHLIPITCSDLSVDPALPLISPGVDEPTKFQGSACQRSSPAAEDTDIDAAVSSIISSRFAEVLIIL